MFEKAAIFSALIVLIAFTIVTIIYDQHQESKNSYLLLDNISKLVSQTSRG
jgi:hypothetical protein